MFKQDRKKKQKRLLIKDIIGKMDYIKIEEFLISYWRYH